MDRLFSACSYPGTPDWWHAAPPPAPRDEAPATGREADGEVVLWRSPVFGAGMGTEWRNAPSHDGRCERGAWVPAALRAAERDVLEAAVRWGNANHGAILGDRLAEQPSNRLMAAVEKYAALRRGSTTLEQAIDARLELARSARCPGCMSPDRAYRGRNGGIDAAPCAHEWHLAADGVPAAGKGGKRG